MKWFKESSSCITNPGARICGLPCSLCRCRAQSASCKARTRLPFSVGPAPWPAAPSACKAMWLWWGWLYVCMDNSCLLCPGIQRAWGKKYYLLGKWAGTALGSAAASVWKGLDGHNETMKRWKSLVYSKLYSEVGPKLSKEQDKWGVMGHFSPNYLEDSRLIAGARAVLYRLMTQQYHLVAQFGTQPQLQIKRF